MNELFPRRKLAQQFSVITIFIISVLWLLQKTQQKQYINRNAHKTLNNLKI